MSSNALTEKLRYVKNDLTEEDIILYDDYKTFDDYEEGNSYLAIRLKNNKIGYVFCSTKNISGGTKAFNIIDKNGNILNVY